MRVLYVATDLRDADILQQEAKRAAPKLVFDVCAGLAESRARLEKGLAYDVLLLDSSLAEADQLQLVQHIRSTRLPLPIVVLSGQGVTPSSVLVSAVDECISRGPRLAERLAPGLRMAIERYRVLSTTTRENERLKRSEARLRLIIEALPAGVVLVDQAGKILAMNLAGASLVGVGGPSDVVGRELYSLADDKGAQTLRDLVGRALEGERNKAEFSCHGLDGQDRRLLLDALCIQREAANQGSVLGVLAPVVDLPAGDAASAMASDESSVEFAFGGDPGAYAEERIALESTIEELRGEAQRYQHEAEAERRRIQEVLAELERARATAAEHHVQRSGADLRSTDAERRVAELEGRCHEAETLVQSLREEVERLGDDLGETREERQRVAREADGLRDELLEQRRQRLAVEQRAAALEEEKQRLTQSLALQAPAAARVNALEDELASLRAHLEAREAELAATLDAERSAAAAHVAELDGQLQALQSAIDAEREAASAHTAERDRQLQALQGAIDAERAAAAAHAADLGRELETLRGAIEAAAAAEVTLSSERDRLHDETARLQDQFTQETQRRQHAESETERLRGELASAVERRSGVEQRIAELESSLAEAQAETQALRQTLAEISDEKQRTEQTLDARLEELAVLATQNEIREALEQRVDALQRELADSHAQNDTLDAARRGLEERLAALERHHEERGSHLRELDARSAELELARQTAVARLGELERHLEERAAQLRELETHSADVEARRQAAVARIAELEESRRNEQGALAEATKHGAELDEQLQAARAEAARAAGERDALRAELGHEHATRRAIEDERASHVAESTRLRADLEAQLASRDAEIARLATEQAAHEQAHARAIAAIEARLADADSAADGLRVQLEAGSQREEVLAAELASLRDERDSRGRQAFDLEHLLARERAERADLAARLEHVQREAADARVRAEMAAAQAQRDHEEVVARLQKLLEQAAAREFQAATSASVRSAPAERGRRRPSERIGQLASAMANDLHGIINEMTEEARRLLIELPEGSTVRAKAEQSLQSANRAGQLVRHLLRLSERESRATPGAEASAIVRANEPLLRQLAGPDVDLRFELGAGLPPVECDSEEVAQVLSTLVVTVRGALPLGGTIRVVTQERPRADGRRRSDAVLGLSVVAEGYGMVPVPTTVCEEVVTRCGGTLTALVEPGHSTTTLTALLPIDASRATDTSVSNIA